MREKRRLLQGGREEQFKPKGPQLDEFSVELETRAEKIAGKAAKVQLALMLAKEEILLAGKERRRALYNASRVKQRTQLKAAEARRLRSIANAAELALQQAREHLGKVSMRVARRAERERVTRRVRLRLCMRLHLRLHLRLFRVCGGGVFVVVL